MRCSIARAIVGTAVLILSLGAVAPVAAQDKIPTPSGAKTSWIGTPPPSDCLIEPIESDAVIDALRLPVAESDVEAFPLMIPSETELPQGKSAKRDEIDTASATLWIAVACLNGGDFPRFFALFTAQGINGLVVGLFVAMGNPSGSLSEEDIASMTSSLATSFAATPVPLAVEEQARIDAIRDARILPDGRMLFLVDGTVGVDATVYAVLRLVDDRWLIDAIGQIGVMPT